jgi:hypothetical protein
VKPKAIINTILFAFMATSMVYMAVYEFKQHGAQNVEPESAESAPERVVVYYFHNTARCVTCKKIEAYTKEALDSGFAEALEDGRLEWRVVNLDEPGNGHYVKDFQRTSSSVVLEKISEGRTEKWKNLARVWKLVRKDKAAFIKHVQNETHAYMQEEPANG